MKYKVEAIIPCHFKPTIYNNTHKDSVILSWLYRYQRTEDNHKYYGQLIFQKMSKKLNGEKNSLFYKGWRNNWTAKWKKKRLIIHTIYSNTGQWTYIKCRAVEKQQPFQKVLPGQLVIQICLERWRPLPLSHPNTKINIGIKIWKVKPPNLSGNNVREHIHILVFIKEKTEKNELGVILHFCSKRQGE